MNGKKGVWVLIASEHQDLDQTEQLLELRCLLLSEKKTKVLDYVNCLRKVHDIG